MRAGRRRCRRSVDLPLRRHVINGLISVEAAAAASVPRCLGGAREEAPRCSVSQVRADLAAAGRRAKYGVDSVNIRLNR
jgi:hypothetical protein